MEHQSPGTNPPGSTQPPAPGWWLARDNNWYPPERHPDYQPPAVAPSSEPQESSHVQAPVTVPHSAPESAAVSTVVATQVGYNTVYEVHWKSGWPGIFSGESQAKALNRALAQLNNEGWRVSAAVTDRWSFYKRLGKALLAIVTLGFVVEHQNIILVVERIS